MQFVKIVWFSSIVLLVQNIKLFESFMHIYLTQNAHLRDHRVNLCQVLCITFPFIQNEIIDF